LSGELGGGLPLFTESKGSFCVGSIMCAMRVCTRPDVGSSNHVSASGHQLGVLQSPSPVNTKSNLLPVDMPFDAYEATLAQSTNAFSAPLRGQ
jgi:hypothetical protein